MGVNPFLIVEMGIGKRELPSYNMGKWIFILVSNINCACYDSADLRVAIQEMDIFCQDTWEKFITPYPFVHFTSLHKECYGLGWGEGQDELIERNCDMRIVTCSSHPCRSIP